MALDYDEAKRASVLQARGLDFADADQVFAAFHLTRDDEKHSGDEQRFHSIGVLNGQVVIVTWTPRGES